MGSDAPLAGMATTRSDLAEEWRSFYREHRRDAIASLASAYPDDRSLYVDVVDLHRYDASFSEALLSKPDTVLAAARDALRDLDDGFDHVNVRVENVPGLLAPGDVRSRHVDELVAVQGEVVDLEPVHARLEVGVYRCRACDDAVRRERFGADVDAPVRCEACGAPDAHALDHGRSTFVDVRRLTVADLSASAEGARTVGVVLQDDLVDAADPGEQLLATGIVRLAPREAGGFEFFVEGLAVNEERPGGVEEELAPGEALQDVISSRWRRAADEG